MKYQLLFLLSVSVTDAFAPQQASSRVYSSVASQTQKHSEQQNNGLQQHVPGDDSSRSFWDRLTSAGGRIDEVGRSLKPKARQATVLSKATTERWPKIKQWLKAVLCHVTYVLYAAFRGVAVVMPPVYRQLYAKFSSIVEYPFDDRIMTRDVNPETSKLRWRTRINVGLLAGVLCASYVVTGALRVLRTFVTTVRASRSFLDSVAATVDAQEENELKMKEMGNRPVPDPKKYF